MQFLRWEIVDRLTPFAFPAVSALGELAFAAGAGLALRHALRSRRRGSRALAPAAICLGAVLFLRLAPLTRLWLAADFALHRSQREAIVARIERGELRPASTGLIPLGDAEPRLSRGGNEVLLEENDGTKYVLFFTFRGVLGHYAGFLHVSAGGAVERFDDLDSGLEGSEVVPWAPQWWFVSRH